MLGLTIIEYKTNYEEMKLCICTGKQMPLAVAKSFTRLLPSGDMFM